MRRRTVLVAGAAMLAGAAQAQPAPRRRLVFVTTSGNEERVAYRGFRARLAELGWVEGTTLTTFFFNPPATDVAPVVQTLLATRPDIIVTDGRIAAMAAAPAVRDIPIVAMLGWDPVELGLARSIARPGGNVTGVTFFSDILNDKRLEMLLEVQPNARQVGIVYSRRTLAIEPMQARLTARGMRARSLIVAGPEEIETVLAPAALAELDALLVLSDSMLDAWPARVVAAINRSGKPAMFPERQYAVEGGLLAYGADLLLPFRRLAELTDRVLRGGNPAEMAFERPERLLMTVNLKTAAALALDMPAAIMARADEVIE